MEAHIPRKITPLLTEALAQYLAIRSSHCAATTMANDKALLTKFVRESTTSRGTRVPESTSRGLLENTTSRVLRVHDLNQTTVETWFAREATRQAASSFNKVRMRVAGFLGFCQRRGWLTQDLLAEVRPRRVVQRERLRLSAQELRRLYETAENPRDRAMLAIACNTGLRASDLVALRIGDVDLDQGLLRVHVQKTGRLDFLPITADLDSELRRWLTWYGVRRALQDSDLLTPALAYRVRRGEQYGDPEPDRPLAHPARVVHKGLARLGMETSSEGFHTIRRSVGRLLFEQASDSGHDAALRITASLLGHQSTAATTRALPGAQLHDRVKRDALLKGQSLLSVDAPGEVVPMLSVESRI